MIDLDYWICYIWISSISIQCLHFNMECELKISREYSSTCTAGIGEETWYGYASSRLFHHRVRKINCILSWIELCVCRWWVDDRLIKKKILENFVAFKKSMPSHRVLLKVCSKMIHGRRDSKSCLANVTMSALNRNKCKVYCWMYLRNVNIYCMCGKLNRNTHEPVLVAFGYMSTFVYFVWFNLVSVWNLGEAITIF